MGEACVCLQINSMFSLFGCSEIRCLEFGIVSRSCFCLFAIFDVLRNPPRRFSLLGYAPFGSQEWYLGFESSGKYSLVLSCFFGVFLLHHGQSFGSSAPKSHCSWVRLTLRLQVGHCLITKIVPSFYQVQSKV